MKVKFLFLALGILLSIGLNAQQFTGKVVNKTTGLPVAGASIAYGDNSGTVTNDQGEFVVDKKVAGKQVEITSVGYKSQKVKLNKDLTVQLEEDLENLSEVVVVGYGRTSKDKLTGSVATITSETLAQYPGTSLVEVLQGRVAGLTISKSSGIPGAKASINIRGTNTLSGALVDACGSGGCCVTEEPVNTEPLIVVDGVPFINQSISPLDVGAVGAIGPLATLSTADVERIDVLKDADATAIYGSRGANGVILITTKSAL
jgi:TonB-dependent SusC/RagA subfamily outer membrane receptor